MSKAVYLFDSNAKLLKKGSLTYGSDTLKYTFSATEAYITQGSIEVDELCIVLPDAMLTKGNTGLFGSFVSPVRNPLGLIPGDWETRTIIDGAVETTYLNCAIFSLDLAYYTYVAGRYSFAIGLVDSTTGAIQKTPYDSYVVQNGIDNFTENNLTPSDYDNLLTAITNLTSTLGGGLSAAQDDINTLEATVIILEADKHEHSALVGTAAEIAAGIDKNTKVYTKLKVEEVVAANGVDDKAYTDTEVAKIVGGTYIADKATGDKNGNDIVETYETKADATTHKAHTTALENANMIKSITRTGSNLVTITYYNNTTSTVITLPELKAFIGEATQSLSGLMSAQDKTNLNTLMALFDSDADAVVNTIQEVLDIFQNYPEGVDMVTALAAKEALTNKATDFSTINDIKYPSVKAVDDLVGGLASTLGGGLSTAQDDINTLEATVIILEADKHEHSALVGATGEIVDKNTAVYTKLKEDELLALKEDVSNKKTTLVDNSDTYYPTQKAVNTALDLRLLKDLSVLTDGGQIASNDLIYVYTNDGVPTKVACSELTQLIKTIAMNTSTYVLTITKYDGTQTTIDLPAEMAFVSASYSDVTQDITFTLQNGTTVAVPLDDLVSGLASEDYVDGLIEDITDGTLTADKATKDAAGNVITETYEPTANKVTTFQATPNDIAYPSEKLVKDNLDLKIDKDFSSYTELTTLAEDDEIIVRDVANSLTKKAKMSALINYYGNSREYGVREVVGQSSPTLERVLKVNGLMTTGSATGLVASVGVDDSIVTNSFDSIAIFNRERVTISAGGVENVFVKVPKYYIKEEWTNESGTDYHYWWMCEYQLDGYRLPLPFVTPEQTERDYAYIGAYEAYLDSNSKLRSISGVFPKVSYSRANFRTAARKLDTANSTSKYQITDVAEYVDLVQIPILIEFATKNLQSIFVGASAMAYSDSHVATADGVASLDANTAIVANATGASFVVGQTIGIGTSRGGNQIASDRTITAIDVDTPSAGSTTITYDGAAVQALTGHYIYSLGWKTGRLDGALSSSALDTDNLGKYGFVWRGIENPYANIWKNIDGVKIVNNQAWICTDTSQYDDAASSGGDYAYPYQKLSYVNHNADGYPTELGLDLRFPFAKFPTAIGAGSTTYYSDYYYQNTGDRTAFVGGYWYFGSYVGPFSWLLNSSLGLASVYFGARLSYRP